MTGSRARYAREPAASTREIRRRKKPFVPRERGACLYCHDYLPSRPTGFPQIIEKLHNPMKPCPPATTRTTPRRPTCPEPARRVTGSIEATSRRTHWSARRATRGRSAAQARARVRLCQKPTDREFCGSCHAQNAPSAKEIRRIDLADTRREIPVLAMPLPPLSGGPLDGNHL